MEETNTTVAESSIVEQVEINLDKLFTILSKIPDIHDFIIQDKILCCNTDSNDYIYINLSTLKDDEISENMTLSDFQIKNKTLKILTDNFSKPVLFWQTENEVGFSIDDRKYISRIPLLNNTYSIDKWNEIFESGTNIGSFKIYYSDFQKMSKIVDIYNAVPWLKYNEKEEQLEIDIVSPNKIENIQLPIPSDSICDLDITIFKDVKLKKILFTYSFNDDVEFDFIRNNDDPTRLIVVVTSKIEDVTIKYMFVTSLINIDSIDSFDIDINNIDLNMF